MFDSKPITNRSAVNYNVVDDANHPGVVHDCDSTRILIRRIAYLVTILHKIVMDRHADVTRACIYTRQIIIALASYVVDVIVKNFRGYPPCDVNAR